MNCNNQQKYLSASDFKCVGVLAQHCNLEKLCIAIEHSKLFDIIPLLGFDFVNDILNNWNLEENNPNYEKYQSLICGGAYQSCNGKDNLNFGLKKVWVYYAYAHYLLVNQVNDSPNGAVRKENDWSIPIPLSEITDLSNKYRKMGYEAFKSIHEFLCHNKGEYPKFNASNCDKCECNSENQTGQTKKMTGVKFTMIRR